MIILPEKRQPKGRVLLPQHYSESFNSLFRLTARLHDGLLAWCGWFEGREDADAFLFSLVCGQLRYERSLWRLPTPEWHQDLESLVYDFALITALTSPTGSNQTYTAPTDFNPANNLVEVIGAGGGSGSGTTNAGAGGGGGGGGGGGYSAAANINILPGGTATYQIGSFGAVAGAGGDTWFNGATFAASSAGAKGGSGGANAPAGGTTGGAGGAGGAAASGIGTNKKSGGTGATGVQAGTGQAGGGAAAGPNGDGGSGGAGGGGANGGANGAGGGGNNRFGAGGGLAGNPGGAGTAGGGGGPANDGNFSPANRQGGTGSIDVITTWVSGVGPGSGAGGGAYNNTVVDDGGPGGVGAIYGGGSGGGSGCLTGKTPGTGQFGSQGLIVVSYTPVFVLFDEISQSLDQHSWQRRTSKIEGY